MQKLFLPPVPAPAHLPNLVTAFLAGSIEMGKAIDWQTDIGNTLAEISGVGQVYNPRRDDWDASWVQSIDNENFNGQVNWEMDHIERSNVVFINFIPDTMSPISLLELGYVLGRQQNFEQFNMHLRPEVIVCCPDGFWRKGNVEVMVDRAQRKSGPSGSPGVYLFDNYETAKKILIQRTWAKHLLLSNAFGFFAHQRPGESQREAKIPLELRGQKIPKYFDLEEYLESVANPATK